MREQIINIARGLPQEALRVSIGEIAADYETNEMIFKAPTVTVLAVPKTPWAIGVDNIETPFAPDYDEEEYRANPSLTMMGLFEIRNMLRAFSVPVSKQTDYQEAPLLDRRFLVVGTGPGREVVALSTLGATVTGFDATKAYVDLTAKKVQQASDKLGKKLTVSLYQCPAEDYSYEQSSYDGVTSLFGVLNHVEDWKGTINKISESLKPEGKFVFSMYGTNDALVFKKIKTKELPYSPSILQRRATGGILLGESEEILPTNFPSPLEIVQTLQEVGLIIEKERGYLRIAALFPKNPTSENLVAYRQMVEATDTAAAKAINGYAKPEELLLSAFLYDQHNQVNIEDFAYVSYIARKRK